MATQNFLLASTSENEQVDVPHHRVAGATRGACATELLSGRKVKITKLKIAKLFFMLASLRGRRLTRVNEILGTGNWDSSCEGLTGRVLTGTR